MSIMAGAKHKSVLYLIVGRMTILISAIVLMSGMSICQAQTTKVFLLAGQSNMVGWCSNSDLPQELQQPRPDIQIYWGGVWTYLRPGLGGGSSYFGPEITFCRDIVDVQPGEDIVFVKYAVSGTSLWNDWRPTYGVQYINFMNAVDNALLSVSEPEIVGMIWMQGESDAYPPHSTLEHAQEYQQNLTNFIQSVRVDLGIPDLPFVIGRISQSSVWTWRDIVRQAQVNVSQTVLNTALFTTDDLPLKSDNMHYNASGTATLGTRFADAANALTLPTNGVSSSSEGAVLSWRYAIPDGNNRVLVVGVCGEDDDPCDLVINSVKYNGIDMNGVPGSSQLVFTDGKCVITQLFYLLENDLPTADDYRLEINFSGNVNKRCGGAVTLSSVDQEPPHAVATSSTQDANSISTDITIQTDSAWIVDVVGCSSEGVFTADSGQITEFNIDGNNITIAGSIKPVSLAGPVTVSWNLSDSNCAIAHSIAAFTTTSINTISGHVHGPDDAPLEGVTVTVGAGGNSDTTDPNGYYEVPVVHNWFGTIAPVKDGYLFGPSKRTYSNVTTDLSGQNYKDISIYDLDTDGLIGWGDVEIMYENWLRVGPDIPGDFYKDEDNTVNFLDFADFADVWQED
jgi:hypothetical protein